VFALQQAHATRLRVSFDTEAEERKEAEIEIMTAEITSMFNLSSLKIKKLWRQMDTTIPIAQKVRDNIQRGLATRLQTQSEGFKNVQKAYMRQIQHMPTGLSHLGAHTYLLCVNVGRQGMLIHILFCSCRRQRCGVYGPATVSVGRGGR
jgi:hypothetical protein